MRLVIDPVTRVGGQLRVEADVAGGAVTEAWASGTMLRGIETVLVGRDPRDVWLLAQRVCGTCTGVHALASVRAVERALGIEIPRNARLVRNIMAGTMLVRDHVMVLYQRALPDWVDIGAAASADPIATSRLARASSAWPNSGSEHFKSVRDRLAAMAADQPGPFGGWTGHPAYQLSPEQSLLLMAHMLEAFDWQRDFLRAEALLGGKDPHAQTYLVGGMALAPPWGGPTASRTRQHPKVPDRDAPVALSEEGLDLLESLISEARAFVEQVYVPDVRLLVGAYPEYARIGAGPGNYLAFGDYPQDDTKKPVLFFSAGRLVGGNLERSEPVSEASVGESVQHAWYTYDGGDDGLRRPGEGATDPDFTATVPLTELDASGKYTWVKAARYDGVVMETGPLARILVGAANGQTDIRLSLAKLLDETGLGTDAMPSVIGRMLARASESQLISRKLDRWVQELRSSLATGDVALANIEFWDPVSWPDEADGWSLGEGPRGAVGHWMGLKNGRVDRYQIVDGSTWNASPRDALGMGGPLEVALAGVRVADPAQPLELLRVIHSIAPCAACAAHVYRPRAGTPELRINATETIR
jgi:Ni,Fe-hydrogenase I large subunit